MRSSALAVLVVAFGVDVYLGDGNDTLDHRIDGTVLGEDGDDDIRVSGGYFKLLGGAGVDRLDATAAAGAGVSYARGHRGAVQRRVWLHAKNGRRLPRKALRPAPCRTEQARPCPRPRRRQGRCVYATTATRRNDGLVTRTATRSICLR